MTANELLHLVPGAFKGDEPGRSAVIQYDISEPVYHVLENGGLSAHDGRAVAPDVTIGVSDENLMRLMRGELNPVSAYKAGKLKVHGDLMLAQKLLSQIDGERLQQLT